MSTFSLLLTFQRIDRSMDFSLLIRFSFSLCLSFLFSLNKDENDIYQKVDQRSFCLIMMNRTILTPSSSSSIPSSIEDTEPSSYSSSHSSNQNGSDVPNLTTTALIRLIEQLKCELTTMKEAKTQLATLYKVRFALE